MTEKEQPKKKPKKYDDAEIKKEGSPIETPYKHSDIRSKKVKESNDLAKYDKTVELKIVKSNE